MNKSICLDISVLNDREKTGVGIYTYQLIKALLKINRKDRFILFGISTLKTHTYLKNIEFKNYPNVTLKLFKYPARLFRNSFLLWQKINWPKIENLVGPVNIYHSFNWYLPPVENCKVVATVFDMTPILFPEYHLKKTIQLDKVRFNRIKQSADLVITISQNSKKDFLKFDPQKKVEVIYPAVSDIILKKINEEENKRILKKYNLNLGFLLSVGTLEPRKNIIFLIRAYLKSKIKEKLVLVGKWGWERGELSELINKNKGRIITTGYIDEEDLAILYKEARCFIYPSLYEGFGLPVLEAMQSGTPVISSNTSSLPEVGGRAVLYMNPNNLDSLISALRRIKDQELRVNLKELGFKQARKFSWKESAMKLNLLYQQI